jgi:hypothetical protein
VVAVDAGAEHLFRHGGVTDEQVRDLVYGAMFTRGPDELHQTAVFVGGSNVQASEHLFAKAKGCFFGPMRVSVMLDPNGANTTAAAAVLAAGRHVDLSGATALILAATGPVGQRVARLLARQGATVRLGSRSRDRASEACGEIHSIFAKAKLEPHETVTTDGRLAALKGAQIVISAGAPGVELLAEKEREASAALRVAIDLSAVPPLGLEGIEMTDKAEKRGNAICYGAIGVGGTKMKIHKAAIAQLFTRNDLLLDAEEIYAIGADLEGN